MKKEFVKKILNNLAYAFLAQGISLLISVIMNFVVPKSLSVEKFSYWQLFLFYTSYAGVAGLGFADGIYLKIGGSDYNKLDKGRLGYCLRKFFVFIGICLVCLMGIVYIFPISAERKFILLFTFIYTFFNCVVTCLGYIFQSCNETKIYSISVICDKIVFFIAVIFLLLLNIRFFEWFVCFYCAGKLIASIYCIIKGKSLLFAKYPEGNNREAAIYIWTHMKIGIPLLLANIASSLVIGSGRFIIDAKWGVEIFGKFSFSLTITNFFLLFIGQVSMVLFPALRTLDRQDYSRYYSTFSSVLGLIMLGGFALYYPLSNLLAYWLPEYASSLKYMILLLPITYFDGKMNLLGNTYLKVLRKERVMFGINSISVIIGAFLYLLGAYVIGNFNFVILSMVLIIIFRYFLTDILLKKFMQIKINDYLDVLLIFLFIILNWYLSEWGNLIYVICYSVYIILNRKVIIGCVKKIKQFR